MTLPVGTISMSQVNTELSRPATQIISLNEAAVRTLAGVPSGAIGMNNLQGKSNRVAYTVTIGGNTANYDAFANRGPQYQPGISDITFQINPGVYVFSNSTGAAAFAVPNQFNAADTVRIVNNGVIVGRGGDGGRGGYYEAPEARPGLPGGGGGPGLFVNRPTTVQNNNLIAGGGGGGGGGGAYTDEGVDGGGGGGGGIGNSSGGAGGNGPRSFGGPGGGGNLTSAGGGGGGGFNVGAPGGPGGGYGSGGANGPSVSPISPSLPMTAGGAGGGPGAAVQNNGFITWTNFGNRAGPIS